MAGLLAVVSILTPSVAISSPADIFEQPAPVIGTDPPARPALPPDDVSVSSQTGAIRFSYPIRLPPARQGMVPRLELAYSSQAPVFGGIAANWAWNLSIPEIREDVSHSRLTHRYPIAELNQADPRLDDRFTSTLAGGRPLVLVGQSTDAYLYRAANDSSFARYDRMKSSAGVTYKWRVLTPDGITRYFGDSGPSFPGTLTGGCSISDGFAPLTREVDQFGNEIWYEYLGEVVGECRIESVIYGQNPSASLPSFAQVDFTWAAPEICASASTPIGALTDYRTGTKIVTGASRLTTITATAFAPGGSPASAVHTRQIALGYETPGFNAANQFCGAGHAPIRELRSITESAWGTDSPLVTLPSKTFTYNSPATTLGTPTPNTSTWGLDARRENLAWGFRRTDDRWPTVEGMMLDVDGDALLDRVFNTSNASGAPTECSAAWQRNKGPNASGVVEFEQTARPIWLPRLRWHGTTLTPGGAAQADPVNHREGCSLNGQYTAYRNSQQAFGMCHDGTSCAPATNSLNNDSYCNIALGFGTECPPGAGGPGTQNPNSAPYITYLAYRWLDVTGDGLVDLVAAVHGDIDVYDIGRGNNAGFSSGEESISGIPRWDQWPPCPTGGSLCIAPGTLTDGARTCSFGTCTTNWSFLTNALHEAPQVACSRVMAKPGTDGGGGSLGQVTRWPYERCQGRYPWMIYVNRGNGEFATTPVIKYQPVPLESDSGDSSTQGPGVSAQNHTVMDFDGDGALDALVREDDGEASPGDRWFVFLGDRSGQFGPELYYYPTRAHATNPFTSFGLVSQGLYIASSTGVMDLNGDGAADHWAAHTTGNADVALNIGVEQLVTGPPYAGTVETPSTPAIKPGNESSFQVTDPTGWAPPATIRAAAGRIASRLVDVDADGRADVVHWNGGNPQVFFNAGGSFITPGVAYPGNSGGVERSTVAHTQGNVPDDFVWELKSDLIDLDGDGLAEGVFWNSGMQRARPAAQPPRLLSSITNGRGATTNITYASLHDKTVVEQNPATVAASRPKASPITHWVVATMASTDTFTPGIATTSYFYRNPVHGADDDGRFSFRGFEEVITTSPSGQRTIQRYSYSPDWSGRLVASLVMPKLGSGEGDNDVRTIDRTEWDARTLFGGAITTYHPVLHEHFVCKNGQTESTCTPTSAGAYTRTTPKWSAIASSSPIDPTPLLWQETASLLQAQTTSADGDRETSTTFGLASDATVYRLRPLETTSTVRIGGVSTMYARSAKTWDASYRVQLTDETWVDSDPGNRAITRFAYDMTTGNVLQTWKPEQNAANTTSTSFVYDARKLFVATESNELPGHVRDYKWEYGTGTKLETNGPNVRGCITDPVHCPEDAGHPLKQQNKIRVDGLGRMIERWESFSGDGYIYNLVKVETNAYVDTATASVRTSVDHHQKLEADGTVWKHDMTQLDGHGRVAVQTVYVQGSAPADQVTTYVYRPSGTLQSVTVPDPSASSGSANVTYTYGFDSLNRPTSIRRPDDAAQPSGVDIAYDGASQTTTEFVGAAGGQPASTKTVSDAFGRLSQVYEQIDPSTWAMTTYGYGPDDQVTSVTDPEGVITTMTHDLAGRRTQITRAGRSWKFAYDRNGNVVSQQVPGSPMPPVTDVDYTNTTAYDDLDRPTSRTIGRRDLSLTDEIAFGGKTEVFVYDIATNMMGRLRQWHAYDRNGKSNVGYDTRFDIQGRPSTTLVQTQLPGLQLLERWYYEDWYASGHRFQVRYGDSLDGAVTWSDTYLDPRGLPSSILIRTIHDSAPPTHQTVAEQTRNVAGLVTKRRTNVSTSMGYVESNWTYDKLGRVVDQVVQKGPGTDKVAQQTLTYLGNDNPATLVHWLGTSSKTFTFQYDQRHQLIGVTTSVPSYFGASYEYGAAGRLTAAQETQTIVPTPSGSEVKPRGVSYVYGDADPERVTALTNVSGGTRYATMTYDAAGNMTSKCLGATFSPVCLGESFEYVYDGKDQLRRATRKENGLVSGIEEYWYDKDGQRFAVVKKNAASVISELVWFMKDTQAHYDSSGTLTRIYSHMSLGTPVARVDRRPNTVTSTELQFHGLASNLLAAVSTDGAINTSFAYAPFGTTLEATDGGGANAGVSAHRRRFNDKHHDELTSLAYYGARYFDKGILGWTQSDPHYRLSPDRALIDPRRANLYSMSLQNPLRYVDPDGRSPEAALGVGIGVAQGARAGIAAAKNARPAVSATVTAGVAVVTGAVLPVVAGYAFLKLLENAPAYEWRPGGRNMPPVVRPLKMSSTPKEPEYLKDPPAEEAGESPYRKPGEVQEKAAPEPFAGDKAAGKRERWLDKLRGRGGGSGTGSAGTGSGGSGSLQSDPHGPDLSSWKNRNMQPAGQSTTWSSADESAWMYEQNTTGDVPIEARRSF